MKKIKLFLLLFLCSNIAWGQISKEKIKQISYLQFSNIITGNSFANFGNYAAINSTDESLKASFNIIPDDGRVLELEVAGGATEGITAFFSDGELNSKIKAKLSYHWIFTPRRGSHIGYNTLDQEKIQSEKEEIEHNYEKAILAFELRTDSLDAQLANKKLIRDSNKTQKTITKLNRLINTEANQSKKDSLSYERDVLSRKLKQFKINKISVDQNIERVTNADYRINTEFNILKKKNDDLIENEEKLKTVDVESIDLTWFSFGYGINKDAFKLFDSSLDFEKQIYSESYTSQSISIAISNYRWESHTPNHRFWSLGLKLDYTNNLNTLTSSEVVDTKNISTDPQREAVNTQKVFIGEYEEDLEQLTIFLDYYHFFKPRPNNAGIFAFHFNPKVIYTDGETAVTSVKLGLMIPFKEIKKPTSIVNFELFYEFNDVFNRIENDNSLSDKNIVGLSAAFPLNFLNN